MRDDTLEEERQAPRLPFQRAIASVGSKAPASEVLLNLQEHLAAIAVLADRQARPHLPADDSVGRGEIETVKHPSPSMYPEMYDGRSQQPCREPAYCAGHRFAIPQSYE